MTSPALRWIMLALSGMTCTTLQIGCGSPAPPPPPVEKPRVSLVKEARGTVRLDGLAPLRGFASGRDCTFMHSLELVLDAVGRRIDYDELMGISGLAFRIQFHMDRWDVGNPDPLVGDNCVDVLMPAIGMGHDLRVVRRDELAEAESLRQDIALSIDRQMPVLATNVIPPEDWGIITGYRGDRTWLCRSYHGGAERIDRTSVAWPTAVVLLSKIAPRPMEHDVHVASIRRAITLFEQRRVANHAQGGRAFDRWCDELRQVRSRDYIHANAWMYVSLCDARSAAVRYLRSIAKEFGSREHYVLQAADYYEQELRLLVNGYQFVPSDKAYADSLPSLEMRLGQIGILRRAKALEERAIEALRRALN